MLMHMKRTTLILDTAIYAELKRQAAAERRTLTERIERALRAGLAAESGARRHRVALPSYDLGPYLVDPHDRGSWDGASPRGRKRT
jgi:hypothetical protein